MGIHELSYSILFFPIGKNDPGKPLQQECVLYGSKGVSKESTYFSCVECQTIREERYRHEKLEITGTYKNVCISSEFEVLTATNDRLMVSSFGDLSIGKVDPLILWKIQEESLSFFENHSYSRLDIMLHSYRKLFYES